MPLGVKTAGSPALWQGEWEMARGHEEQVRWGWLPTGAQLVGM